MSIQVHAFYHHQSGTLSYLLQEMNSAEAAIIDPVMDFDYSAGHSHFEFADQLVHYVQQHQLQLRWILETHAHADHLSAAQYIKQQLGGQIAIGQGITKVQQTFSEIFNLQGQLNTDGSDFDQLFNDGDEFYLGEEKGVVMATPGHTNDSLSYLIDGNAFVGDSLFMPDAGTARCDFPGGSAATLYASVKRLYQLPDTTRIYIGHDYQPNDRELRYMATVAEHKVNNIHIQADTDEQQFVAVRQKRDATLAVPDLIIPSIQVNIRAGNFPPPEDNGQLYLKVPINRFS